MMTFFLIGEAFSDEEIVAAFRKLPPRFYIIIIITILSRKRWSTNSGEEAEFRGVGFGMGKRGGVFLGLGTPSGLAQNREKGSKMTKKGPKRVKKGVQKPPKTSKMTPPIVRYSSIYPNYF